MRPRIGRRRRRAGTAPEVHGERSCDAQRFAHYLVVNLGALLGAEVEAHFVDDLDAQIAQPVLPAVGTDAGVDLLAQFAAHGRLGKLVGAVADDAAGPLAAKAAWPLGA